MFVSKSKVDSIGERKIFLIRKGEGVFDIAKDLEKEGFISNRFLFLLYVISHGKYNNLHAGTYLLSKDMSISEIAQNIWEGKVAILKVTIPEGFTLSQIEDRLLSAGIKGKKGDLLKFRISDWQDKYDFLKDSPKDNSLEGFLFPDTYYFPYDAAFEDVVKLMLDNFGEKLTPDLRQEIARQHKKIYDIIIMASIVEKEVSDFKDRRLVSGILWKRLKNGIPLQADATISYITGKKTTKISKEDTEIDSPYNTYKYLGLPIAPISNPGLESILASLYPEESDWWYYLSTPEGKTIFSKTLKEHNIAKNKYLK